VKEEGPVFNLDDSDDSDDDFGNGSMDRFKSNKNSSSSLGSKSASVAESINSKKRRSPRFLSDSDASEDSFDIGTPKKVRTTKGKSEVVMKKPINLYDSDDDNIEETNSTNSDSNLGACNRNPQIRMSHLRL